MNAGIEIECLYCGRRFTHYESYYQQDPRCPCGETKQLRVLGKRDSVKGDIFGYRYDPKAKKKTPSSQAGDLEVGEAGGLGRGDRPQGNRVPAQVPQGRPGSLAPQGRSEAPVHRDGHGGEDRRAGDSERVHHWNVWTLEECERGRESLERFLDEWRKNRCARS